MGNGNGTSIEQGRDTRTAEKVPKLGNFENINSWTNNENVPLERLLLHYTSTCTCTYKVSVYIFYMHVRVARAS